MTVPLWALAAPPLAASLALLWPWWVRPARRAFWSRFLWVAGGVVALVLGQALLEQGARALTAAVVFLLVAAAYLYTLARLDDMDDIGDAPRWTTLASLLLSAAALIRLNPALGFVVSVCTMIFLGACMPLRWHQRVTLPLVVANVWLLQAVSVSPATLVQAFSDGVGLLVMAGFGYVLHRSTRLSRQLAVANAQLARQAEQEGELATLRERSRLARELHDTLGHALTTITVQLEAAGRLQERRPAQAAELVAGARELSRSATVELRASLSNLRAADSLSIPTLRRGLQELAARGPANGPLVTLELCDPPLPPSQAHALLRVAGEALHNAWTHAGAQHIRLTLSCAARAVQLEIHDDGRGFDPAAVGEGHYGLTGMRERVAAQGGQFGLESRPGQGTRVLVRLPLDQPVPARGEVLA